MRKLAVAVILLCLDGANATAHINAKQVEKTMTTFFAVSDYDDRT